MNKYLIAALSLLILLLVVLLIWFFWKKGLLLKKQPVMASTAQAEASEVKMENAKELQKLVESDSESDNLQQIEGIGPKIEQLLNKAGIQTFADLSASEVSTLKEILVQAGSRFTMHDPSNWPKQAMLAKEGKWQELQELKDSLVGGR
jgi:predicted flap endonuclease-1-like 5' DNA nuclease